MKQPKNLLYLLKPTRNTRKIANKLMTVASGEINLQKKKPRVEHELHSAHGWTVEKKKNRYTCVLITFTAQFCKAK